MPNLVPFQIEKKCIAIVCFGPLTEHTGTRAGQFYQAVIDPSKVSPCGQYLRFDADGICEVHGWQRIDGLTICSVLAEEENGELPNELPKGSDPITMFKAD